MFVYQLRYLFYKIEFIMFSMARYSCSPPRFVFSIEISSTQLPTSMIHADERCMVPEHDCLERTLTWGDGTRKIPELAHQGSACCVPGLGGSVADVDDLRLLGRVAFLDVDDDGALIIVGVDDTGDAIRRRTTTGGEGAKVLSMQSRGRR